jgi:hypothetical protein
MYVVIVILILHANGCTNLQGKQHSAIQMYKRCLMQDMSDLVPLHNIATEYRRLGLVNAEIEALQLLAKV